MNIALARNVNNPFRVTIVAERINVCKLSSGVLQRCAQNTRAYRNDKSVKLREIMLSSDKPGVSSLRLHPFALHVRLISAYLDAYTVHIIPNV